MTGGGGGVYWKDGGKSNLYGALHIALQMKGEKPPAPTLGQAPKGGDDDEGGDDEEDGGGGGEDATPAVNMADLVPRNDIRY